MKNILYLLAIVPLLLLCGCLGDERKVEFGNDIQLSTYNIQVMAGLESSIDVLSDKEDLVIVDQNAEIATGWWANDGKKIIVKTHGVGNTSITVRDRNNQNNSTEINVVSEYLHGTFEVIGERSEIIVLADNPTIQEKIIAELKTEVKVLSGVEYTFDKITKLVNIDYTDSRLSAENTKGSYQWTVDTLIITTDNFTEEYTFGAQDNNSFYIKPTNITEIIRKKYPDVNINTVTISYFLSRK